jgi:protein associated with RNAse G/E
MSSELTVRSLKYDGRVHREWRAELLRTEGSLIVVEGVFEEEVRHPLLGTISAGTVSTEYYWDDRWYSVFRFREPAGELRNYYCNINTPARLEDNRLTFVDLDIDVLVAPDFSLQVLDEDEFEAHEQLYNYPPEFRGRAREALAEVCELIRLRRFPFDATRTIA